MSELMDCSESNHIFLASDRCQCGLLHHTNGPEGLSIISFLSKPKSIVYTRHLAVGDEVVCTKNPTYSKRSDLMAKLTAGRTYTVLDILEVKGGPMAGEQRNITLINDDNKQKSYSVRNFEPVNKRIYINKKNYDKPDVVEPHHVPNFLDELESI